MIENLLKVRNLIQKYGLQVGLAKALEAGLSKIGSSAQKWNPIFDDETESLIPPRELWVMPTDSVMQFLRWTWHYQAYLALLCDMREDSSVLELGCSHGRTMLGLLGYLRPPGKYEGLDIMRKHIEFAQKNIHTRFPFCNFTCADVYNAWYNPQGRIKAETFKFPYPDCSFDLAYAASLFTHLLPLASMNYFKESRRVVRKGGKCLFSFFFLENYRGPETSTSRLFEFDYPLEGFDDAAVHNPKNPENLIAYKSSSVKRMAVDAGFEVKRVIPGCWSKTHELSVDVQDLLILEAV